MPGSSQRFIDSARSQPVDEVFFDLEDAVAPLAKSAARGQVVAALRAGGWEPRVRAVRINDVTTPWVHGDVTEVLAPAAADLDCVILPKVSSPAHVHWLDLTLGQVERAAGLPVGRIGIEAQIEDAAGLAAVEGVAGASARLEALVFGPADFMASLAMPSLAVGEQPAGYDVGDAFHYVLARILVAARAHGLQAIDGPYLQVRDEAGFRRVAGRSAALGYDGKWVLHPAQVAAGNAAYSPTPESYEQAERLLEAYAHHISAAGGARGAAMLGAEMVDEASRKLASAIAARGRAAGLGRTGPPAG